MSGNESLNALVAWMGSHPVEIEKWMSDPQFRQQLLDNPQQFGLADNALDWVNERLRVHGVAAAIGPEAGFLAPF
jgi:hypothetical protein